MGHMPYEITLNHNSIDNILWGVNIGHSMSDDSAANSNHEGDMRKIIDIDLECDGERVCGKAEVEEIYSNTNEVMLLLLNCQPKWSNA